MLFFTAPPIALVDDSDTKIGHSIKYLAAKSRREEETAKKRKAFEVAKAEAKLMKKKAKIDEEKALKTKIEGLKTLGLEALQSQLAEGAQAQIQAMYGEDWQTRIDDELSRLVERQQTALEKRKLLEQHEQDRLANSSVKLGSVGALE